MGAKKKMFEVEDACLFDLVILALFVLFAVKSLEYNPRARAIPLGLGIVGSVMMLLQFLADASPAARSKLRFTGQRGLFANEGERVRQGQAATGKGAGGGMPPESEEIEETGVSWIRVLRVILWLVSFVIVLKLVHYLVGVGLFLLFMTRVEAKESWTWSMGVTVGTCILFFLLFEVILGAHL